jgi:hypothetical protein
MPTTFSGLFLFSTALSLVCTFTVLGVLELVGMMRSQKEGTGRVAGS